MFLATPRVVKLEPRRRQQTLKRRVDITGFGLWTGTDVVFSFCPAENNSGIRFFRDDLPDSSAIPALVENRIQKPRQTSLASGAAQVDMVEHALAALRAARIDNCDVHVSAAEAPGLDGSCAPFLSAFLEAGVIEQEAWRTLLKIETPGKYTTGDGAPGDAGIEILPCAEGECVFEYTLHYDPPGSIKNQTASFDVGRAPEDYLREIASCRTFLTLEEANALRAMGVCQRVTAQNALVFSRDGVIDNRLRFENECARHKVLDMTGDFALAPVDWQGKFCAFKTGHQQNAEVVAELLRLCE